MNFDFIDSCIFFVVSILTFWLACIIHLDGVMLYWAGMISLYLSLCLIIKKHDYEQVNKIAE